MRADKVRDVGRYESVLRSARQGLSSDSLTIWIALTQGESAVEIEVHEAITGTVILVYADLLKGHRAAHNDRPGRAPWTRGHEPLETK